MSALTSRAWRRSTNAAEIAAFENVPSTLIHYTDASGASVTLTLKGYNITTNSHLADHFIVSA